MKSTDKDLIVPEREREREKEGKEKGGKESV